MQNPEKEKGSEAKDVDVTAAGRGVWLVKVLVLKHNVKFDVFADQELESRLEQRLQSKISLDTKSDLHFAPFAFIFAFA